MSLATARAVMALEMLQAWYRVSVVLDELLVMVVEEISPLD
jgi:hypothetical protein